MIWRNFFFVLFFKDDMPNFLKSFQTTGKQTVEHTHVCLLFKLVQHTIIWESFSSSTWIPSWTMILKICAKFYNKLRYILILLPNLTWLKGWKSWGELKYYNILKNLTHILHLHIIIKLLHFFQFSNTLVLYVVSVGINKITFEI